MNFNCLKTIIDQGNISISGQPFKFFDDAWSYLPYLRARNKDAQIVDLLSTGWPCILLGENGCALTENERPKLGLLVKPTVIGGPCEKMYDHNLLFNWIDYCDVLEELIMAYTNKGLVEVLAEQAKTLIKNAEKKHNAGEQLSETELVSISWYYNIMVEKPYYTPQEYKKTLFF